MLFDYHEGWELIRLNQLGIFGGGKTPSTADKTNWGGTIPWISSKEVKSEVISGTAEHLTVSGARDLVQYPVNSLVFVVRSGILRRTFPIAILGVQSTVNQDIKVLRLYHDKIATFVQYCLKALEPIILTKYLRPGTTVESIEFDKFEKLILPLPPLSEQYRILENLQNMLLLCNNYRLLDETLTKLDTKLQFDLTQSILQNAIQGKLVPQDPNDKPVQIQCKNPIIRRDNSYYRTAKGEEICIDEQLPFEIPSNWTWIGLFDICDVQYGYPFDSTKFNDNKKGVPLVRIRDLLPNKTKTFTTEIVSDEYFVNDEDMLIGMDGNFNLVYWSGGQAYLNQRVCKIKCKYESVNKQFIGLYLQYALKNLDNKSYTTVQHLSDKQLRSIIVPIPPYNEQNKIVEEYTKCILLTNQLSY